MRHYLAVLLLAGTALAGAAWTGAAHADRRTIALDASELSREAAAHFPRRDCLLGAICVTLSEPRVELRKDDERIFVVAQAQPEMPGQALESGTVEVAGVPRYDAAQGAFFLDRPAITRTEFASLSPAYASTISQVLGVVLDDYLKATPIHKLDERDPRQSLAKLVLRGVAVREGRLEFTIGDDD